MVVSGGVNVPAAMVERVLVGHPGVAACAVVGRPDAGVGRAGGRGGAADRRSVPPGVDSLRAFAADALEPAALPREVVLLGLLPVLASGKPDKVAVRTLLRDRS